jgi:tol-pal system protein YbgF
MSKFSYISITFAVVFVFLSGCAGSSKMETLENRITSLEMEKTRQMQKVQEQEKVIEELKANSDFNKKNYAALKAELRNSRATIQRLRGIVEETDYKFSTLDSKAESEAKDRKIKELNNQIAQISKHIVELEQYIGIESSKSLPVKADSGIVVSTETEAPSIDEGAEITADSKKIEIKSDRGNPETIYKNAKSLLDKEEYDAARLEFEKFINLFPDSKNADNARYWIADSYYREKWYEKSILEYQKVIEEYSDGNKVAAALLKQGYSFAELGEKANARLILKELIKKYPDSKEAGFAEKKLESLK